jgi:putative transcriptional regulator
VRGISRARPLALAVLLLLVPAVSAQPAGLLLVAKPSIVDPNFARTVIAVAQAPDGAAIGVIVNRPLKQSLAQLLPDQPQLARFTEPLRFGGPVEASGLFALYAAAQPVGESLTVAERLHLALFPPDVERLLASPPARLRFFAGYSGWGPGQLAAEIDRGDWWVLDATEELAFRDDTRGLWEELRSRASQVRTRLTPGVEPRLRTH